MTPQCRVVGICPRSLRKSVRRLSLTCLPTVIDMQPSHMYPYHMVDHGTIRGMENRVLELAEANPRLRLTPSTS